MTQAHQPSTLFFFFGSLRRGYWNQGILSEDAVFIGSGRTTAPFKLYIGKQGHVPTCTPDSSGVPLIGELYALNPRDAVNVYRLETGYESGSFEVELADGQLHQATIFHHTDPKACSYLWGGPVLIPSGDYTDAIAPDGRVKPRTPEPERPTTLSIPAAETAASDGPVSL